MSNDQLELLKALWGIPFLSLNLYYLPQNRTCADDDRLKAYAAPFLKYNMPMPAKLRMPGIR